MAVSTIKMRRKHGENDNMRIADRTAPTDPVPEHRTLQPPPPSTKHPDIHAAPFPHAIKNYRHEPRPALVIEHRPNRARMHYLPMNAFL